MFLFSDINPTGFRFGTIKRILQGVVGNKGKVQLLQERWVVLFRKEEKAFSDSDELEWENLLKRVWEMYLLANPICGLTTSPDRFLLWEQLLPERSNPFFTWCFEEGFFCFRDETKKKTQTSYVDHKTSSNTALYSCSKKSGVTALDFS